MRFLKGKIYFNEDNKKIYKIIFYLLTI